MALLEVTADQGDRGTVRLTLTGELDISSAPQLDEELAKVEAASPPIVVLDLRSLEFMDSTGLRTIVTADARAREEGRRLAIVRGPDAVHRVFSVTRLDERLDMIDDPAAVEA
ncbi:MAG TPA: STAS domain-containing protein [Solirubrobacteraceae bacterium]|jgi:anti-anti-sigma factor|nr:STAS domain-containing protein [Solirubrobacteraceae bacterium]